MDLSFSSQNAHYAFGKLDRVKIEGIPYQLHMHTEVGYVFSQDDTTGRARQIDHAELARLGSLGRIRVERDYYDPRAASKRQKKSHISLNALVGGPQRRMSKREAYCQAAMALHRESKLKFTDESLEANMSRLRGDAVELALNLNPGGRDNLPLSEDFRTSPSPRTLRRWLKASESLGLLGLVDNMSKRGNRAARMSPEAIGLMMGKVRNFLSKERPLIKQIVEDVQLAFHERNEDRAERGLDPLHIPSRETIRRAIRAMDPFAVECARNGEAAPRKKYRPVMFALHVSRALQRVEIDEWTVDVMTLMQRSGIYALLSDEDKVALVLHVEGHEEANGKKKNKKKDRWTLTAAICCATRCIVGMVLSRNPSAEAAVQLLQMITTDKGALADAVGSLTPWDMHGTPELLVFDGGSTFKSQRFRHAAEDLGIAWEMAMNGLPENRGFIERVFRTFSTDFAPRLAGHTFRGIMEKGAADPIARAALNVDDFTFALIRWVADIYHNTPYRGLGGERPVQAWRRLSKEYGVTPPPDMAMMRLCFGQENKCRLDKTGITILGVTYQSEVLQNHFRRKNSQHVDVRWHPKDLGEILVCLDGKWFAVPALDPALDGVAAQTWLTALRRTRSANPTSNRLDLVAVREAIKGISERNAAAMAAAGLNMEDWSPERIKKAERSLLAGVEFFERAALVKAKDQLGQTIPSVAGLTGAPDEQGRPRKERAGRAKAPQTSFSIEED